VSALLAGSVEVDNAGRANVIWVAGQQVGFRLEFGRVIQPENAVKAVLSATTSAMHAYSAASTEFVGAICLQCGGSALK